MNDKEAIKMMQRSIAEIEDLRRFNQKLQPYAEAYGVIQAIIGLLPQKSQGYSEDHVWALRKRIRELEENEKKDTE